MKLPMGKKSWSLHWRQLSLLALLVLSIVGCSTIDDGKGRLLAQDVGIDAWRLIARTSLSCGSSPNQPPDDTTINVYFREVDINGQLTWCPYDVEKPCPDVFEGKDVTWQAQRNDGTDDNPDWVNLDTRFRVWFHPLQGTPLPAPNGSVTRQVDQDAPKGVYKYTVWDWPQQGNQDPVCDPLDPNFHVF